MGVPTTPSGRHLRAGQTPAPKTPTGPATAGTPGPVAVLSLAVTGARVVDVTKSGPTPAKAAATPHKRASVTAAPDATREGDPTVTARTVLAATGAVTFATVDPPVAALPVPARLPNTAAAPTSTNRASRHRQGTEPATEAASTVVVERLEPTSHAVLGSGTA